MRPSYPFLTIALTATVVAYHAYSLAAPSGEPGRYPNAASREIGEAGYVARYLAGQLPALMFRGEQTDADWLFLREEIPAQFPFWGDDIRSNLAPQVASVVRHYEARGVRTVIIPVPTKISIERDRLGPTLPSQSWWQVVRPPDATEDARGNYNAVLLAASGRAVDLFTLYADYRAGHPTEFLFAPQDSHWTSLGISLAAQAALGQVTDSESLRLVQDAPESLARIGYDFPSLLQLPSEFADHQFRWREPLFRVRATPQKEQGRLILAGTSYGGRFVGTPFGLGSQMAGALGRELINEAFGRAGPNGSFRSLAARHFSFRPGDILVWEFPIRTLFESGENVILLPVQPE